MSALAEHIFDVIASALDDGHDTPEDEQEAAVSVVLALYEAGFVVVAKGESVATASRL